MGLPFFTTDTVAVQRALETHCDAVLFTKNGVDGVYSADPKVDPTATRYDRLSYEDAIGRNLRVIDQTAFTLAQENKVDLIVFGLHPEGNVLRVVQGERIGTLVTAD
jgi:uridylate kinase